MTPERNTKAIKLLVHHYWQRMKHDWRVMLPSMIMPGIGSTFVFYGPPLILAKLLSRFQHNSSLTLQEVLPYIFAFGCSLLAGELLWRIAMYFLNRGDRRGIEQLYVNALDYLLAKDMAFFNSNFAGSLTKKAVSYAANYEIVMDTISFSIFANLLPLFFVLPVLWYFSPWLVLSLVGMVSLSVSIILPRIRKRQKMVADREAASNVIAGHISDVVSNIYAVRGFTHEDFEAATHKRQVKHYMDKAQYSWDYGNYRINSVISPLYILTNILGLLVALAIGHNGAVNIQTVFVTFNFYAIFSRTIWEFNTVYRILESKVTEAAQFTELLLDQPALGDPKQPQQFLVNDGKIDFKHVYFQYQDDTKQHLFDDLNLSIHSGEKIGLVGHSGGGKTTITKLMLRFMDINSGEILIDNQNIASIKQTDLRSAVAYVPQEPLLFHRSIMDNIRYGQLDATKEQVYQAAQLANAAEFISQLPSGYNTLVGERGVKLSGGQRQRIAIARAMLKNAPILVLDEATSSLDSDSERLIQDALWKLMQNRTALVIAHRLSTVQKMDRIIVLDKGKIIEDGTHQELLARPEGKYAKLWAHQSGGFLDE